MATGPDAFRGDARFTLTRELGRGGMGIVYEALDRERGESVALKTLPWADPSAIYRFKKEFRALADVAHRNLVNLYELVARDEMWFFTMELVKGRDLLTWVRPGMRVAPQPSASADLGAALDVREGPVEPDAITGVLDVARLRSALQQLAEGVAALHQAGKVHRDLKPPNVLVTDAGRVVILDFGISDSIANTLTLKSADAGVFGTAAYIAPELWMGEPCASTSDWYSVGVLLYEALTGQLPFHGPVPYMLFQKTEEDPPRPDHIAPGLPNDLVDICVGLMARQPVDRMPGAELLRRLGVRKPAAVIDPHAVTASDSPLVGRTAELAELERAFAAASQGEAVSVCVHGPSGIGKSMLVHHFTDTLQRTNQAVVLTGRCYVRETVPYKALDGVIDMLSRLLRGMSDESAAAVLPRGVAALARVFPVLRRVDAVDRIAAESVETWDQRELRRQAFSALLEVVGRISRQRAVVIHIDDLQWADRDSVEVLDDLLGSPGRQRLLFVLSFRSEEVENVPFLKQLIEEAATPARRALAVRRFTAAQAAALARSTLGEQYPGAAAYAETIARESDGNPFLLDQILRFVLEAAGDGRASSFSLDEMLEARVGQMPDGARELVQVLAIAGQPIDAEVAYHAAGLTGDERPLVASLEIAHLVRSSSTTDRIDLYHDRIREHYVQTIGRPTTRLIHRRLAEGLEDKQVDDPEALYEHYLGAGDAVRAAAYAVRTAQVAWEALAFERSAQFYRRALDLAPEPGPDTQAWNIGLGDALSSAGRCGAAATAYLEAATTANESMTLDLERRAGQQLLISGRIDEGLALLGRVLERLGLQFAPSPRRALLALLRRRVQLKLRGLHYEERDPADVPAEQLTRIDTCWAIAEGLGLVDNIQGAAFQTLHLLLALEAGEPYRVARALAMEAGFIASTGSEEEAVQLLKSAEDMGRRLGSHSVLGLCKMIDTIRAFYVGECAAGEGLAVEAEELLGSEQRHAAWQLSTVRAHHVPILLELGKVDELCRLSRQWYDDSRDRGNRFSASMVSTGWGSLMWLRADDVAGARQALANAVIHHRTGAYYLPDFYRLMAQLATDLYSGDGAAAYRHVTEVWPILKASQLLRIRVVRLRHRHFRAWSALAAAREDPRRRELLRVAERDARELERERHYSPSANRARAQLIYAGVQAVRGDDARATEHLTAAIRGFKAEQSWLMHAVAQRRLGEVRGGDEGKALIATSDAWMAGQRIANPVALSRIFAPGFSEAAERDEEAATEPAARVTPGSRPAP
jgi:tRNA A-37 threonylcarbamoyl transferase component Bud32